MSRIIPLFPKNNDLIQYFILAVGTINFGAMLYGGFAWWTGASGMREVSIAEGYRASDQQEAMSTATATTPQEAPAQQPHGYAGEERGI
jgi:hypothetical protein